MAGSVREDGDHVPTLRPRSRPDGLKVGDSLPVRVLLNGKPVAGFALGCVREGAKPGPFRRTGADGKVTVPFPDAGRHLLYGTHLRRGAAADADWESDFTTLTLDVRRK